MSDNKIVRTGQEQLITWYYTKLGKMDKPHQNDLCQGVDYCQ
jgi:hypothetical protein